MKRYTYIANGLFTRESETGAVLTPKGSDVYTVCKCRREWGLSCRNCKYDPFCDKSERPDYNAIAEADLASRRKACPRD